MWLKVRSIRTNLFFLVLLLIIPFVLIILFSANKQKTEVVQNASDNALRLVNNLASQQAYIENSIQQFLTVISKIDEIKNLNKPKAEKLFSSLLDQNPSYASLLLCDSLGNMIVSGKGVCKLNVADRKYFKDVMSTRTFSVGEYTKGRLSGKPVIHYAYPVINEQNKIQSIVIVSFDLKYYDNIYKNLNLSDGTQFTFTDGSGKILFQSPDNSRKWNTNEEFDLHKRVNQLHNDTTFWYSGIDNHNRLFGVKSISLSSSIPHIYIFVAFPEEIAYSRFNEILRFDFIAWGLAILFVLIMSYWYSHKYIISPIDKLVKIAGVVSEGKLDMRTGITDSSTELGKLAIAFDDMTEKLMFREVEQRCADKEMRKVKERFEMAINSAHIGIWDWHIPKNHLVWDRNMFAMYGVDSQKFGGSMDSWFNIIHKEDKLYFEAELSNAIEYHQAFRSEFRIIHPDQGIKYIRIFANIIKDKQGKPVRLIGVNWDISERKILERKLSDAKNKAEESDKLKSTFLANISHELRTPLHGILGFVQFMKDNNITEEEKLQYSDLILKSGHRLMNTVSNIIDISVIDSGKMQIAENEFNIVDTIREIYTNYEAIRIKENKKFSLLLDLNIDHSFAIFSDQGRFVQVIGNLLDNAFKYTEKGTVMLGCRINDDDLVCYVKDSGVGISHENVQNVFERFKSENENGERRNAGTGLGLAICKGFVELMKGRIWAVKHKTGTEIIFTVPIITVGEEYVEYKYNSLFS